ncbi:hypothetical protein HaLaN_07695 [Haematococcus lacustris]|uniref:Uncharacterized protein n=1 Tax=Haematococcus lacustris TaxID=44745 RepID=A0A699YP62_HAELA|nr:hypothetical protein HaLaN_07695 [Haematococcus lacustris]
MLANPLARGPRIQAGHVRATHLRAPRVHRTHAPPPDVPPKALPATSRRREVMLLSSPIFLALSLPDVWSAATSELELWQQEVQYLTRQTQLQLGLITEDPPQPPVLRPRIDAQLAQLVLDAPLVAAQQLAVSLSLSARLAVTTPSAEGKWDSRPFALSNMHTPRKQVHPGVTPGVTPCCPHINVRIREEDEELRHGSPGWGAVEVGLRLPCPCRCPGQP